MTDDQSEVVFLLMHGMLTTPFTFAKTPARDNPALGCLRTMPVGDHNHGVVCTMS